MLSPAIRQQSQEKRGDATAAEHPDPELRPAEREDPEEPRGSLRSTRVALARLAFGLRCTALVIAFVRVAEGCQLR